MKKNKEECLMKRLGVVTTTTTRKAKSRSEDGVQFSVSVSPLGARAWVAAFGCSWRFRLLRSEEAPR